MCTFVCCRWLHSSCDGLKCEEDAEKAADYGYHCLFCRPKTDHPGPCKSPVTDLCLWLLSTTLTGTSVRVVLPFANTLTNYWQLVHWLTINTCTWLTINTCTLTYYWHMLYTDLLLLTHVHWSTIDTCWCLSLYYSTTCPAPSTTSGREGSETTNTTTSTIAQRTRYHITSNCHVYCVLDNMERKFKIKCYTFRNMFTIYSVQSTVFKLIAYKTQ